VHGAMKLSSSSASTIGSPSVCISDSKLARSRGERPKRSTDHAIARRTDARSRPARSVTLGPPHCALSNAFFISPLDAAHLSTTETGDRLKMQNIFVRALEDDVGPAAKMQAALGDLVGREVKPSPKPTSEVAANVDSLAQRAASLGGLKNVIDELQQLHDFLAGEGRRLEQEIAEYAELKKSTAASTHLIAENLLRWKESKP
jgi:hypothetical protein